jgi:hypothetical protein
LETGVQDWYVVDFYFPATSLNCCRCLLSINLPSYTIVKEDKTASGSLARLTATGALSRRMAGEETLKLIFSPASAGWPDSKVCAAKFIAHRERGELP